MQPQQGRGAYMKPKINRKRPLIIAIIVTAALLVMPATLGSPGWFTLGASNIGGFDVLR